MKVLSLTEPCATLIYEKKKSIETRSWKTDYRGELYIHASATNIPKEWEEDTEFMSLVEKVPLHFGHIICKCNLIDCILMTEEYVEIMKKNNYQEYICGKYEPGRYAWILSDIVPLDKPIKAKGQLNIWNYYDEFEIMSLMENIQYGWANKKAKIHHFIDSTFLTEYKLQSPQETIKYKVGICWDQVELERYYFKANNWNVQTFFLVYDDKNDCPTHTFLTFFKENKYYWFEHAWEKFKGIHEYSSKEELLVDVKTKFCQTKLKNGYIEENLFLLEYKKPKAHLSVSEFYNHCTQKLDVS